MDTLWTDADDADLAELVDALAGERLLDALLVIEGASARERATAERRLEGWSREVAEALSDQPSIGAALAYVLGVRHDLHGDTSDYYAPRNSYLSAVLERRRGLPILLSAVWILVGRRLGCEVAGVGLPGHFVVRVGGVDGELRDPFSAGAVLDIETCRRLVSRLEGVTWSDAYLAPTEHRAIVERVLRNLVHAHDRQRDTAAAYRCARMLAALRPDDAQTQLLHIKAARVVGAHAIAEAACAEVERRFSPSKAADIAGRWRLELVATRPLLN